MNNQRTFTWKTLYAEMPVEEMPWYFPGLDSDLEKALKAHAIDSGTFLDLGTGPGTQAIELAKRGFSVTGTDISNDAIKRASALTDAVEFINDDILNSKLTRKFDYVFDRGCFHVMSEDERPLYTEALRRLLKPGGWLFLKCFSDKEPDTGRGPYRISKQMIDQIFSKYFLIKEIRDTEFQGNRQPPPKALFAAMQLRKEEAE